MPPQSAGALAWWLPRNINLNFKNMEDIQIFLEKVKTALKNGWSSNGLESCYWLSLVDEAEKNDQDALTLLRAEFKYNENFKSKTGAFKNV